VNLSVLALEASPNGRGSVPGFGKALTPEELRPADAPGAKISTPDHESNLRTIFE